MFNVNINLKLKNIEIYSNIKIKILISNGMVSSIYIYTYNVKFLKFFF